MLEAEGPQAVQLRLWVSEMGLTGCEVRVTRLTRGTRATRLTRGTRVTRSNKLNSRLDYYVSNTVRSPNNPKNLGYADDL